MTAESTSSPVDQHVRDTISRSGLDRTLFVEAGAGTGKTTQLVTRIANLVVVEGVRLANVAAITFTDAAAAELRDRVRVRFEQLAADADDPLVRERAVVALADADLAAISTLHGFAQRILSEHPAHSGLPPRIGVLDEVSSTIERAERWERFVDLLHDDPNQHELLVRAALLGIVLEPAYPGQPSLQEVAVRLNQSWDRLGPAAAQDHPPLPPVDFEPFDRAVAELSALPEHCDDPTDRFYCRLLELIPQAESIASIDEPLDKLRALTTWIAGWGPQTGGRNDAWGGDVKAAKALVGAVAEARDDVIGTAAHEVLVRLVTRVARDLIAAAEARRVEGRLEFHDLLVFASRLLETSPASRSVLHDRYTHLLLDEFQDTDPLQIHLAVLIAASVADDAPSSWRDAEVEPGRLFFVGDPKQSIYRFRRADIELFLDARASFGGGESLQRLSTNFRTVDAVIDWVNAVFHQLMAEEIPGMQPAYEPLHAHRGGSPIGNHRPVLLGGPHHEGRAPTIRAAEAAHVAEVIADIRDHPERWPVGTNDGGWRPATLDDITILIPTRTELPALQTALTTRDIAHHLATGTLIYETQEVRDALAALRAIDDPSDELALVSALRSPLYGCTDVDLLTFHEAGGRWDLRRDPPAELAASHCVVEGLSHLRVLWEQRWWVRPSELLDMLLQERQAALVAFGGDGPDESWSRLRFLVDQSMAFEESGGGDLRAFLHWAELQRDETITVHQPVAVDGADGAVSIMTIHGAKGLEFPITVLSGMSAAPPPAVRGASVIFDPDGRPGVHVRKGISTRNHGALVDREHEMSLHEQIRLLYVAATRARDHLVVSAHHKVNKAGVGNRSFGHRMWEASEAHPDLWRRHEPAGEVSVAPTAPEPPSIDPAIRAAWANARRDLLDAQHQPRTLSATAIARLGTPAGTAIAEPATHQVDDSVSADEIAGPADDAEAPAAVTPRRRGRAGTAIGRATHATLQVIDLHAPLDIDGEAARQAHLESIPELADTVAAMVRSALASATVRNADRYHREVYVAAPVGQHTIEGYVDLLVETAEGLIVVDYKTDTVRSEAEVDAKLAAYELQGAAYAVALETATGLPVVGCRFVFCRAAGAIEREVDDLGAAMARVRQICGVDAQSSHAG